MTDLIRRLRGLRVDARFPEATMYEAANELERQAGEIERLRGLLDEARTLATNGTGLAERIDAALTGSLTMKDGAE